MLNKDLKIFAITDWWKSEEGYSLLIGMLALTIIVISLPILLYGINKLRIEPINEGVSVLQFFIILRNETLLSEGIFSDQNRLYYRLETGETAKIEYYPPHLIRRQVEGRGHEVYLRNVKSFKTEELAAGVKITVITQKGDMYEKVIGYYE